MGLITIVLLTSIFYNTVQCNTVTTTKASVTAEQIQAYQKTNETHSKTDMFWKTLLSKTHDLNKSKNSDMSKRKSKILGSLAFLAGLSVGGLATAASSTVKTYARLPQASLTLNLGPPKLPYVAAYYDPYSFIPHPYHLSLYPFGVLPFLGGVKPQNGEANQGFQQMGQNQLVEQVGLFNNKRPEEEVYNEDEYVEESKKTENDRNPGNDDELQGDRTTEDKLVIRAVGCPKLPQEDLQRDANNPQGILSLRAGNTTSLNNQTVNATTPLSLTANMTENSTNINPTGYPVFPGYYGGQPQDISHVGFTTEPDTFRYDGYDQINYNLPYDKPANFYPEDKYSFYSNPPTNSFPSSPYLPEQIPEYLSGDFNRLYTPENAAFGQGFRPVL